MASTNCYIVNIHSYRFCVSYIGDSVVVVEGHNAKSVAFDSATVSFVNLDITPK